MDKTNRCDHSRYSVPVPATAADAQCVRRPNHQGEHRVANGDTWGNWTTCGAIDPTAPVDSFRHSPCQLEPGHHGEHLAESCHRWGSQAELISLGADASGRDVLVQRGGAIHGAATVESAAALYGLVCTVMESGSASDSETAAFVEPLMGALGDLLGIMRQGQRAGATAAMYRALSGSVREPVFGDQARALGAALRAVRGDV